MIDQQRDTGWVVVDAGLKASSFDSGLPTVYSYPQLEYLNAGDEHGKVRVKGGASANFPLELTGGENFKFGPGHCDPTVNMKNQHMVIRHDRVEAMWPITARGEGQ